MQPWWRPAVGQRMTFLWLILIHVTAVAGLIVSPLPGRYCRDLSGASYRVWSTLQVPLLALSFLGGAAFRTAAFFWLGALRLVFALHGQCFVNSVCHLHPEPSLKTDSSRNVRWLAVWHLFQGENWHRNHHLRPGSARLGWTAAQVDIGWWVIVGLERLGLATKVQRPKKITG